MPVEDRVLRSVDDFIAVGSDDFQYNLSHRFFYWVNRSVSHTSRSRLVIPVAAGLLLQSFLAGKRYTCMAHRHQVATAYVARRLPTKVCEQLARACSRDPAKRAILIPYGDIDRCAPLVQRWLGQRRLIGLFEVAMRVAADIPGYHPAILVARWVNTASGETARAAPAAWCPFRAGGQEQHRGALRRAHSSFNGILIFPLVVFALLAQLLLSPLLFGHHCAITGVIRAQCGDQSCLLRQRLLLFCSLLACQLNRCDNSEL